MIKDFAIYIGGLLIYTQKQTDGILRLMLKTFITIFTKGIRGKEVIRQMYIMGYEAIPFISIVMAILGVILVKEFGSQGETMTGSAAEVGGPYLQLIVRQFGPFITGMMVANKIATSIAAEVASMKTTDQLDALRMNGADPIWYIAVPRFIAGIIMIFILVIYAVYVAEISGMLTAKFVFEIDPATFINYQFVTGTDIFQGVFKTMLIGAFIPIIGIYAGLTSKVGAIGVGEATTKAVVMGLSAVGMIDLIGGITVFLMSGWGWI